MVRNRVLSFMSQFSATSSKNPTPAPSPPSESPPLKPDLASTAPSPFPSHNHHQSRPITPPHAPDYALKSASTPSFHVRSVSASGSPQRTYQRSSSRPLSMIQTYQPPVMDIEDTIPELQPIFSFLNSHSNKLYQEGYFLKLDDQNTQGRPNPDRTWTECFAQLVGTVLSLWDASELDAAGEDGEVLPKFINLTDASIKMIESLPTRSNEEQPLQNILSISTAGRNRYLLHFNSHHSLVQWTAGIRLAMFENNTLQEAYTGALIAGKGKTVNNINVIMERSRFKTEEWVRVRFGAGVPWRRCWCVISPPDEKEFAKLQKELKKRSPYDRSAVPVLKGDIKFYDTRKDGKKQKKAQPIASITDAHAAYAIYPQAKSLIDASTLLKIEGHVTIHSDPPSATEGFVFIMPEVRPAVSGFEMLLRFLFPTWDTFGLYGRPGRLVASTLDSRSLMYAMPKHKRYGYLEILDVTALITEDGSSSWNEKEWRKRLKEATGARMNAIEDGTRSHSRSDSRRSVRLSYGGGNGGSTPKAKVGFAEERGSVRSSRSFSLSGPQRTESGPDVRNQPSMAAAQPHHARNSSDPSIMASAPPPLNDYSGNAGPYSSSPQRNQQMPLRGILQDRMASGEAMSSSEEETGPTPPGVDFDGMGRMRTPEPVQRPPAFNHTNSAANEQKNKAYHSPALRRANSRLSSTTLAQLANAGGVALPRDASQEENSYGRYSEDNRGPSVQPQHAAPGGTSANDNRSREALSPPGQGQGRSGPAYPAPLNIPNHQTRGPSPSNAPPSPYGHGPNSPAYPPSEGRRSPYPPGHGPPPNGPQSRPHPDGRGPPPQGFRPSPDSRPGTSASQRSMQMGGGPPHRKPLPDRTGGPAPYSNQGPIDTDDILDSYGDDPGPARQHPYRGPPGDRTGPGGPQGNYGPYGPDGAGGERPRPGVLKTVGGAEPPIQGRPEVDIPNFGPTINYGAALRKPAPGGPPMPPHAQQQRPYSPGGQRPNDAQHRPRGAPEFEEQRSRPWKPAGMTPGGPQPGVSPEQYVQQRAAAAPQYAHARSPSSDALAELPGQAGHPQHNRRRSSLGMLDDGRNQTRDMVNRPSSQGETSSHMSARDREYMARMTGQPLMSVGGNQRQNAPVGPGLVSHIDARERERQQMRQGANQQAAQQAMVQRQQQQAAMHQQIMMQGRNLSPGPGYGPPGSFSRPMGPPSPREPDQHFMPPQGQYQQQQQQPPSGHYAQYHGQAF
ncbi:hypothetical protein NLU13_3225 [Sarocladium strictum]|uniref:PH domain-containing protein n=1 Tax=Sarocladium strictum TaxID=5046 RepID=A0AA39GLL5_SARSR|nr:hypothetical protein NLU13_3225 [Sarocladium strictum]